MDLCAAKEAHVYKSVSLPNTATDPSIPLSITCQILYKSSQSYFYLALTNLTTNSAVYSLHSPFKSSPSISFVSGVTP